MSTILKRAAALAVLPALVLIAPTPTLGAAGVGTRTAFPMCATAGVTSKCIEEVLVNGVALPDISAQYNAPFPYFKVPNYTSPEGTNYSDLFVVNVDELSSLFNTTVRVPGDNSRGIDPAWQISVRINFGAVDLTSAMLRGRLDDYSMTVNAAGEIIVSLVARAASTSWFGMPPGATEEQWVAACTAPGATANFEYGPSIYLMIAKMPAKQTPDEDLSGVIASKGLLVSTNYGCSEPPFPLWDYKTDSMVIVPTAPHFKLDGSQNTGFYAAVIPPAYVVDQFGLSVEEMLGRSLSLTANYSSGAPVAIPLVTSLNASGSVVVTATEDFHYSAPKVRLKKKKSVRTGTRPVTITTALSKVTRGAVPTAALTFRGVTSGKAYVYVADNKNVHTFLETVTIANGRAKLSVPIPTTIRKGKGRLLISYGGSTRFARASLSKKLTIS